MKANILIEVYHAAVKTSFNFCDESSEGMECNDTLNDRGNGRIKVKSRPRDLSVPYPVQRVSYFQTANAILPATSYSEKTASLDHFNVVSHSTTDV